MNARFLTATLQPLFVILALLVAAPATGSMAAGAQDAPASLILNVYTCAPQHDPIDPHQTLVNECNLGTEDISFSLEQVPSQASSAGASTGTGGAPATISFAQLIPGNYRLTMDTPKTIARSYISQCTSNQRTFTYPFSPFANIEPGGRLNIDLLPGEQLTCDWYNVQAAPAESAALTITAYSCNGDVIGPGMCDIAPNVEFAITSPATMVIQHITTGPDGTATFDGSGAFQIEPITELLNRNFCAFDPSAATASSASLTLDPSTPATLAAYYCYPGA